MTNEPADPWLIPMGRGELQQAVRPAPESSLRLFCLPHAGSGAVQFRFWANVLGPTIDVVAIQPPGRENRSRESAITSIEPMIAELVPRIARAITGPYALFGHSMGARLAYEVARELAKLDRPAPRMLMLSGHGAPGRDRSSRKPISPMTDAELITHLRSSGETPLELLDDADFMGRLLPLLKTDAGVTECAPPREGPMLDCPMRVFGGVDDPMWTPDDLQGWAALTTGDCRVRTFRGGHLYLVQAQQRLQLLDTIRLELTPVRVGA